MPAEPPQRRRRIPARLLRIPPRRQHRLHKRIIPTRHRPAKRPPDCVRLHGSGRCRRASLNWLRGPRPLNGQDISFLNDRFRDGKTYLPFTYFVGATPDNNHTPNEPYAIVVESNHVSGEEQGYMKLFIPCGGADAPRPIKRRQRASDGKWFLWEQYLLTGVRTPKASDPWA